MMIVLMFVSVVLFVLADLGVREWLRRRREGAARLARAAALEESVRLDFSKESPSLKRVEVKEPKARVLCVDDEEVILGAFRRILAMEGCSVDTVERGEEALGLVQRRTYDFVFTDLKMPGMDGVEVVKSVKHLRPDVDVVVVTGFATVETAVACMRHGAADYVQKPFTEDELLAFLRKARLRRQDRLERALAPAVHVTRAEEAGEGPRTEFSIPGGVFIAPGHCWASVAQDGTVKVGLDDFAKKLLGRIEAIEFPTPGTAVKAGQPLFSVRQGGRRVDFLSPVSGRVLKDNDELAADLEPLDFTPYRKNWVCVVDGDNLDAEVPRLKVGKSAVALFEQDIAKVRELAKDLPGDGAGLFRGEFSDFDDARWSRVCGEFFRRA